MPRKVHGRTQQNSNAVLQENELSGIWILQPVVAYIHYVWPCLNQVSTFDHVIDWGLLLSGIPLCLLSRAANIFPLAYLANLGRELKIPRNIQVTIQPHDPLEPLQALSRMADCWILCASVLPWLC